MNIAICDDDKGVCSQLEGWIEQYNYENATRLYVDVYHSAETLQQQLQTGQWYDMLFLDIELPQKNGIELGQMIWFLSPENQIIVWIYLMCIH